MRLHPSLLAITTALLFTMTSEAAAPVRNADTPAPPVMPTRLSAPLEGTITSVGDGKIAVNSHSYALVASQVALIDKRTGTDGLLTLADLRVGMRVRYRVAEHASDQLAELWVLRDPQ